MTMTLTSTLMLGFLLGLRHALEADHVAAVATLTSGNRSLKRTVAQGAAWGLGHTLTLMLFGGAVLVAGSVIPESVAQGLEFVVGVMLIALGADALWRLRRERVHFHVHRHADREAHFHAHSHRGESAPHDRARHEHAHAPGFPSRAVVVGMVHGLAGSAALVLLSLEALGSPALGLVYIAIFGLGSILGMALVSVAIAVPLRLTSRRLGLTQHALAGIVGFATMIFGGWIVLRIGFA